mmetsp:Transcript_20737/g.44034  ORF Transcript_20737/g.44034 Transcript_20737/m.44034 type:complete len:200 (+) Transcript_20737:619-1218(+)
MATNGTPSAVRSSRTRTKSKYDGTKSSVRPSGPAEKELSSDGSSRSRKASRRASAAVAGSSAANRTKSWRSAGGTLASSPAYEARVRTRPATLREVRRRACSSAAGWAERRTVCRRRGAAPSRNHERTREKSVSRCCVGSWLSASSSSLKCAQFCMSSTSAYGTSSTSIEESQSTSRFFAPSPRATRSPSGEAITRSDW